MAKTAKICVLGVLLAGSAIAQERLFLRETCNYFGVSSGDQIWAFASEQAAEASVERIMVYTGLPQNFEVVRGNVPNAMAAIQGQERFIVYNQEFMERVKETTRTDWAAVSILAHEIGHHLAGHTLTNDGSRPKTELEADQFSGHVLFKMGSSLPEAKAAMNAVASDAGSSTHPPKSARLVAIQTGWYDARDQTSGGQQPETTTTVPNSNPTSPTGNQGPVVIAECRFSDGGVGYLLSDNSIWMNYLGMQFQVALRTASDDSRFEWYYSVQSVDAATETMLNMFGMSGTTRYGVDSSGAIWGVNMFGACCVQVGQVYPR